MSNKIPRRNFLHTAGLGTLGAAAAGLLTACGETTLPDTSEQTPVDNT